MPQAGVQVSVSGSRQYNESWWEVAGSPGDNGITNLPLTRLNAGDEVYVYVSSNLENNGYDYFEIENASIDDYASKTIDGDFSDSATGECVVERPLVDGSPVDLAKFNPNSGAVEEINNCEILDRSGVENSIGNWPHTDYHMEDFENNNKPLAYPGALTSSGQDFPVYWQASN